MKIVIAGGHGAIALLLTKRLTESGHEVTGLIRRPQQAADVEAAGASALVFDLENSDARTLATHLGKTDAVVFAAGAGYGSTPERKLAVDRDGAILLADAAQLVGIRRYVLISSMGTDRFDPTSRNPFQIYLRVKSEADANIRARDLDWTIVRPSGLDDGPGTGRIQVGNGMGGGTIPRADVAALLARILTRPDGLRAQFEVRSGNEPLTTVALPSFR